MEAEKLIEKISQEQNESSKVVRIALAYAEFASLVKRMREAQMDYEILTARVMYKRENGHKLTDEDYNDLAHAANGVTDLESEVDEYLKKMEE